MRGVAIGLALAIPVGPIALLCMRRTLERGFVVGFATGLGAAVADLIYATLAAFGIGAIESVLLEYRTPLSFVGGLFLLSLAWRTGFSKHNVVREVNPSTRGTASAFLSGLLLTATNPLTVLGFVAIFAGFGAGRGLTDTGRAVSLTVGGRRRLGAVVGCADRHRGPHPPLLLATHAEHPQSGGGPADRGLRVLRAGDRRHASGAVAVLARRRARFLRLRRKACRGRRSPARVRREPPAQIVDLPRGPPSLERAARARPLPLPTASRTAQTSSSPAPSWRGSACPCGSGHRTETSPPIVVEKYSRIRSWLRLNDCIEWSR